MDIQGGQSRQALLTHGGAKIRFYLSQSTEAALSCGGADRHSQEDLYDAVNARKEILWSKASASFSGTSPEWLCHRSFHSSYSTVKLLMLNTEYRLSNKEISSSCRRSSSSSLLMVEGSRLIVEVTSSLVSLLNLCSS